MKRACLLLMLCIGVSGSVRAAPEIRAAGDASAAQLDRKVTIPLARLPLTRLLAELERQTEVELTCDYLLARRRLMIRADGRPLREVMDQVAHFTATPPGSCTWESRNARRHYLREDQRSKDARALLRQRRARDFDRRLQLALEAAAMTPEQRVKLRAQAPLLANRPPVSGARLIQGLTAKQIQFVVRGGRLDLGYDDMNPALQEFVKARVARVQYTVGIGDPATPLYSFDGRKEFRTARLQVRLCGAPNRPGLRARIATGPHTALATSNILYPGVSPEEEQPGWLKKALAEQEVARRRGGLKAPTRQDKSLERRVTIRRLMPAPGGRQGAGEMRLSRVTECLEQLAAQIPLALIAHDDPCFDDYYNPGLARNLKADLVDVTVREALEQIATEFQVSWDMRGDWIRVWSERVLYAEMDGMNLVPPWEQAKTSAEEPAKAK